MTATKPIDRSLLVSLTRGMGVGKNVVSEAELDQWVARLKQIKSRYRRGRCVVEKFLPFVCGKLESANERTSELIRWWPLQN